MKERSEVKGEAKREKDRAETRKNLMLGSWRSESSKSKEMDRAIFRGDPRADAVKIGGCVRCLAPGLLKVAEWWAPRQINMTRLWLSLGWPAMCGFMFWYHAHIMKVLGQPAAAKGGAAAGASFEGVTVGAEMNHLLSREWNGEYTRMIAGVGSRWVFRGPRGESRGKS